MGKNRLTAETPHFVRQTAPRLNADFYHIFYEKELRMRQDFRRCLILFQIFRIIWGNNKGIGFSGKFAEHYRRKNLLMLKLFIKSFLLSEDIQKIFVLLLVNKPPISEAFYNVILIGIQFIMRHV